MSVDLYEPRRMLTALEQRKIPFSFFLDTFFREEDVSMEDAIDIDIDRGGQRIMAAFVNPRLQGQLVERRGYRTRSYKPPYVKPKRVTTAEDALKRQMGEVMVNSGVSPAARAAKLVGKDLGELDDMIWRREEWMAACAVQTGVIEVEGEGVKDEIDFDMLDTHKIVLSGTARWSQGTTASPLKNLRSWSVDIIQEDSGLVPGIAIFGRNSWDDFMSCDEIVGASSGHKSLFDMRAIDVGRIDPTPLAAGGVTYQGYLKELNLDLYTYAGKFWNDSTKTSEWLMHPDKVLVGCTDARCIRHYGVIKDLDSLIPVRRFPKTWIEKDPSVRMLMVQSAPLIANHQPDAFVCATVR
jgi:hypothetical protein